MCPRAQSPNLGLFAITNWLEGVALRVNFEIPTGEVVAASILHG
jgi:hypothetical protein